MHCCTHHRPEVGRPRHTNGTARLPHPGPWKSHRWTETCCSAENDRSSNLLMLLTTIIELFQKLTVTILTHF